VVAGLSGPVTGSAWERVPSDPCGGALDETHIDRNIGLPAAERQRMAGEYASVLNRADWTAVAEACLKEGDDYSEWLAYASRDVPLNAFTDLPDDR
jgi:hypothetical protein